MLNKLLSKVLAFVRANPARVVGVVVAVIVLVAGKLGIALDKPTLENILLPLLVGELGHQAHNVTKNK